MAGFAVSSPDPALFVKFLGFACLTRAAAMQQFGSDGSNSGHGGCALETALLTQSRSRLALNCIGREWLPRQRHHARNQSSTAAQNHRFVAGNQALIKRFLTMLFAAATMAVRGSRGVQPSVRRAFSLDVLLA